MRPDDELFDEVRLRRALRLDSSELPRPLDAAAIAALAETSRPRVAATASALLAIVALAALCVVAVTMVTAIAPAFAGDAFAAALDVLVWLAIPLERVAQALQEPTVPMVALVAVVVATVYEYRQRRGRADVIHAS